MFEFFSDNKNKDFDSWDEYFGDNICILDVETTGLFPEHNDRIVEVAVIKVDKHGVQRETFTTLVNPERDIGPIHVHGISASQVIAAPKFSELADPLAHYLSDSVVVGHNISFDIRFVQAEYKRIGLELPTFPTFCTMKWAPILDPNVPNRKLSTVCECFGVELGDAHTAEADALATARLFSIFLKQIREKKGFPIPDGGRVPLVSRKTFQGLVKPREFNPITRKEATKIADQSYIQGLLGSLQSDSSASPESIEYSALLDRVLEDRLVTQEESSLLLELAKSMNLSLEDVKRAHKKYLTELVRAAYLNGVVSSEERSDLEKVAKLLCMDNSELEILLQEESNKVTKAKEHIIAPTNSELKGKSVCFTGELLACIQGERITREMAENLALEAGLVAKPGVTKKLDILVVADPNTSSGKAKKAREYGTRIIADLAFWKMIGVGID